MKSFVHAIFRRIGLRVTRFNHFEDPIAPIDLLPIIVENLFGKLKDDFYFIQIGANDGVRFDSLAPLIRRFGLVGCCVEPMADVFAKLVNNYADQPQVLFRNVMIGDADDGGVIHRFCLDVPVSADFFHGLERQDLSYIKSRAKKCGLDSYVESLECEMWTFTTLIKSLGVAKVSLLCVDTEGVDDLVVRQALDANVRPQVIQYEWTEMSIERRFKLKMQLLDCGYRFIDVGGDTVCYLAEQ